MQQLMKESERVEWYNTLHHLNKYDGQRQYALTFTSQGNARVLGNDGQGAIWLAMEEWVKQLEERDNDAVGVVFWSAIGRDHAHGFVETRVGRKQLERMCKGAWVQVRELHDRERWIDYMLKQAADMEPRYIGGR